MKVDNIVINMKTQKQITIFVLKEDNGRALELLSIHSFLA